MLQLTDHGVLNMTRDGFIRELGRLGYEDGKNVTLFLENANGDMATVNSILDKFLHDHVDVVVPISTGCTQAAINKIKDQPVVFATVANPFLIGAGTSDTDHLPNVTGVYGAVPMDKMVELMTADSAGKDQGRLYLGSVSGQRGFQCQAAAGPDREAPRDHLCRYDNHRIIGSSTGRAGADTKGH